ncbi:MAG: NAD-dependent epimerase/dehydratase family protein [bacterium]|nr:NAD-dependent epimerase/dehydratase family protein [bacterium]
MQTPENTPICITGGAGFIGSNLIGALIKNRRRISVIDLKTPHADILPHIAFFKGDFSDQKILDAAVKKGGIIVHLGGTSNQATSEKDPVTDTMINIPGTLRLLEAASKRKIAKFVFMSSAPSVYGVQKKFPIPPTAVPNPISAHGIMKLAIENYIRYYAQKNGFSYVNLRCVNIYGPGQLANTHGVVSRFIWQILHDETVEIWGSPDISRDFLFVDDFIEALMKTFHPRVQNTMLHIASCKNVSLGTLLKAIEKAVGKKAKIRYRQLRSIDMPAIQFATSQTRAILKWKAATSIDEGVRKTAAWLRGLDA